MVRFEEPLSYQAQISANNLLLALPEGFSLWQVPTRAPRIVVADRAVLSGPGTPGGSLCAQYPSPVTVVK